MIILSVKNDFCQSVKAEYLILSFFGDVDKEIPNCFN